MAFVYMQENMTGVSKSELDSAIEVANSYPEGTIKTGAYWRGDKNCPIYRTFYYTQIPQAPTDGSGAEIAIPFRDIIPDDLQVTSPLLIDIRAFMQKGGAGRVNGWMCPLPFVGKNGLNVDIYANYHNTSGLGQINVRNYYDVFNGSTVFMYIDWFDA